MRAFIGIPVAEDVLPDLFRVQGALEVGRPVEAENWHITLAFLGDQDEVQLEALHEGLGAINAPPFDVAIKGVDALGASAPKALAALAEAVPPLVSLRRAVRSAVHQAGIDLSRARFRPHITLARFRRNLTPFDTQRIAGLLEAYGDLDAGRLRADHFALYCSHLHQNGARYEILATYALTGVRGENAGCGG